MNVNVSTPDPLLFDQPGQWPKWIRRFTRYKTVSGLEEKPGRVQVDTLLIYTMGDKAEDILATIKLSLEDSENFDIIRDLTITSRPEQT